MPAQTATQRLADHLLGGGLEEFVRSRRPSRSWRLIARDLYEAIDLDVTHVTIAGWYPDPPGSGHSRVDTDDEVDTPLSRTG
jgi:hypothetical protein